MIGSINPSDVTWDAPAAGINPDDVVWDQPERDPSLATAGELGAVGGAVAPTPQQQPAAQPMAAPTHDYRAASEGEAGAVGGIPAANAGPGYQPGASVRDVLAPDPRADYGTILPFAVDRETGAARPALPSIIRSPILGLWDIAETARNMGQGRAIEYSAGPDGRVIMRPSPEAFDALTVLGGISPASRALRGVQAQPRPGAATITDQPPVPVSPGPGPAAPGPADVDAMIALARQGLAAGEKPRIRLRGEAPPSDAPRSVGAAGTPSQLAARSAAEENVARIQAERNEILERARPGDAREIIPGWRATRAELEMDPVFSQEIATLRVKYPDRFIAHDMARQEAMSRYYGQIAGSESRYADLVAARRRQAEDDLAAAWRNKGEADTAPVYDAAREILAGPDGRRPLVRSRVASVLDELSAGGKAITDPEMLYGARKHVADMLSKEARLADPQNARVEALLMQLRDSLDGVIESAAPGYQQYLKNFAANSRPIEEARILLDAETDLFSGPGRTVTEGRFSRWLNNLREARAADGVHPAKSISPDTWAKLVLMKEALQREAASVMIGRSAGSSTVPHLMALGRMGILGLAHAGLGLSTSGVGNIALELGRRGIQTRAATRKIQQHFNPKLRNYQTPELD